MWEEDTFATLPPERQAQIEVVGSAFDSVVAELAYLTMPVTAGKRLYELLRKYGVKTKEELERKRPGALWEEVVLPNIEQGKKLASTIHNKKGQALVVPGIFNATKLNWSQHDYMVLWLRFITASAKEIYLAPDWEYSTGGVMEFVRGMMIQFRFVARKDPIVVRNEQTSEVDLTSGALSVAYAIRELRKDGFDDSKLSQEFLQLSSIALTLSALAESDRERWERHVAVAPSFSCSYLLSAAHSLGMRPVNFLQ